MGRQVRNFRNTKSSGSANNSARSYAKINRFGGWHTKIKDWLTRKNQKSEKFTN